MKKILFSFATLLVGNLSFGQVTLDHSFSDNESVAVYSNDNELFYVGSTSDNKLKIYNADYSLRKTINVPVPANYSIFFSNSYEGMPYSISKNIFNLDDKYEFMVEANLYDDSNSISKLILINEDGVLIKDFHSNPSIKKFYGQYTVYHDISTNMNKLIVNNRINSSDNQYDVYSLPTSVLTSKEIHTSKKLSAFPIPTSKTLTILNPKNGSMNVVVYDVAGKIVLSSPFSISENKIILNVENLPKGTYIYKIGNISSKFIKN